MEAWKVLKLDLIIEPLEVYRFERDYVWIPNKINPTNRTRFALEGIATFFFEDHLQAKLYLKKLIDDKIERLQDQIKQLMTQSSEINLYDT